MTSGALLVREVVSRKRTIKILEVGTLLLFGGLASYTFVAETAWSIPAVRLCVDAGLLLVVLASIAVRQPFTLQYGREQVSGELWNAPEFVRVNYIITWVWAGAFALMTVADLMMLFVPSLPTFVAIVVTVLAIWGAARFTSWYPKHGVVRATRPPSEPEA